MFLAVPVAGIFNSFLRYGFQGAQGRRARTEASTLIKASDAAVETDFERENSLPDEDLDLSFHRLGRINAEARSLTYKDFDEKFKRLMEVFERTAQSRFQ